MPRKYNQTQLELVRSQGYKRGLNVARTMLVKAKNYQAQKGRATSNGDADIKAEYEHAASCLHGLCLKLGELLKDAKKGEHNA